MTCEPDAAPVVTGGSKLLTAMRFLEDRFSILRELMRTLDLVTLSGQEDVMNEMLLILRREVLRLESPIAAADLASLSNAMTELEHEAGQFAPTPSVFNRHVELAIGALRRTAIVPLSPHGRAVARRRGPRSPKTGRGLPFPSADRQREAP
jgi:hypothetical protein